MAVAVAGRAAGVLRSLWFSLFSFQFRFSWCCEVWRKWMCSWRRRCFAIPMLVLMVITMVGCLRVCVAAAGEEAAQYTNVSGSPLPSLSLASPVARLMQTDACVRRSRCACDLCVCGEGATPCGAARLPQRSLCVLRCFVLPLSPLLASGASSVWPPSTIRRSEWQSTKRHMQRGAPTHRMRRWPWERGACVCVRLFLG